MAKKSMASDAKRIARKATIVAMAAVTGVTSTQSAAKAAMADMKGDFEDVYRLEYTWDPFDDGMFA